MTSHAVIFDIDGTLLQSAAVDDALYRGAVRSVLGPVRFRESLHDYDYVTDSGILFQVLDDNGIDPAEEPLGRIKARFVELLRAHIATHGPFQALPGARKLLQRLYESKLHSVGIATGGWRESALLKLEAAGFGDIDIPLATSNDAIERTRIMEIALARLGDSFASVTYYGDGPWDQDACAVLAWDFVPVGPTLGGLESFDEVLIGG